MSAIHASGRKVSDEASLELHQMYHDALKNSGDVSVEVAGGDQDGEDMARMGRTGELQVHLHRVFPIASPAANHY